MSSGTKRRGDTVNDMWRRNRIDMSYGHNPNTRETSILYFRKRWHNVYLVKPGHMLPVIIATLGSKAMAETFANHTDGITFVEPAGEFVAVIETDSLRKLRKNSEYGKRRRK